MDEKTDKPVNSIKIDYRRIKQIIYGGCFVLIVISLIVAAYFIWFRAAPTCFDGSQNGEETGVDCGGTCMDCEIRFLAPFQTSWIKYFSSQDGTVIVAEIKNLNIDYGAKSFFYSIEVYDGADKLVGVLKKNSFIYDGEIKYLIEPVNVNSRDIKNIKISFSDIRWESKKEFPRPEIQLRGVKTKSADPNNPGEGVVVSGFVTNNNAYNLSKVRVMGFLFKKNGAQLTASKNEIENLGGYEEKFFKINFPKNLSLIMDNFTNANSTSATSSDDSPLSTLPTVTAPKYSFSKDLEFGSKDDDVEKLQEFLKDQGLFNYGVNGIFDSTTRLALIKYQRSIGILSITGKLDAETRDYINSLKPSTGPNAPATSQKINLFEVDPARTKIYVEAVH